MRTEKRIALLTGGTSSEREIALLSAQGILEALRPLASSVTVFDFPKEIENFLQQRNEFDVAIPLFHGKNGEDGSVQGFLEILNIPYLFSTVETHALALNKAFTKDVVSRIGILNAPYQYIQKTSDTEITYQQPSVIKPIHGGSSIGISIARNQEEFTKGINAAFEEGAFVLIEDYILGDEYTVAIIEENGKAIPLPVIAIKPKTTFFDYESKYKADLVEEICPAPISDELSQKLQHAALQVHEYLGARHLTRSDFIVDKDERVWFLEVNTIPGQTVNSLVPKAIRASGRDVGSVFVEWIERA